MGSAQDRSLARTRDRHSYNTYPDKIWMLNPIIVRQLFTEWTDMSMNPVPSSGLNIWTLAHGLPIHWLVTKYVGGTGHAFELGSLGKWQHWLSTRSVNCKCVVDPWKQIVIPKSNIYFLKTNSPTDNDLKHFDPSPCPTYFVQTS